MYGYADAFNDSVRLLNEGKQYDWYTQGGPQQKGEWLAPAYAGLAFLYIQPDSTKIKTELTGHAGLPQIILRIIIRYSEVLQRK